MASIAVPSTAPPLDLSFKDTPNITELFADSSTSGTTLSRGAVQRALKLSNNRINDISALHQASSSLIKDANNIKWIDLSFNQLTTIDAVILKYPNLTSLNLHANLIRNISEVDKLSALKNLKQLTIHGNPIEMAKPKMLEEGEVDEVARLAVRAAEKNCQSGFINLGSDAENPLNYRSYVIRQLPQLIRLDFTAITRQDRANAIGH